MRPALSTTNAQAFREQLTPFIEHARKAERALARPAAPRPRPAASATAASGRGQPITHGDQRTRTGSRPGW
jgi:hypothetical protein